MAIAVPRYTIEDLEQFPDDGSRYELLDGVLLVTPSPSYAHQSVATQLAGLLVAHVQTTKLGWVVGPGVVVRPPRTQLQPDVLVVPRRFPPSLRWDEIGESWLAIEVLSRSSRIYDRDFKRDAYFALGVHEVWLVDPRARSVEICRSTARLGSSSEVITDVIHWRIPSTDVAIAIDLAEIFAGLD